MVLELGGTGGILGGVGGGGGVLLEDGVVGVGWEGLEGGLLLDGREAVGVGPVQLFCYEGLDWGVWLH